MAKNPFFPGRSSFLGKLLAMQAARRLSTPQDDSADEVSHSSSTWDNDPPELDDETDELDEFDEFEEFDNSDDLDWLDDELDDY